MEGDGKAIDIDAEIDNKKLGGYQLAVICLCAATLVFDGFDNQTIGLLAPSIAKDLHLSVVQFGVVFSSGLFGWMVGALSMGPVSDRFGRRRTVIISAILFGLFTLVTTRATSITEFTVFWFLTGLGLGGAVPNALALATEFAPSRLEAKVAGWVITGVPVGAIVGGVTSTLMLPVGGWRGVLYIGSALPILMALFLIAWLPESARFLIAVKADTERVKRIMRRIAPQLDLNNVTHFRSTHSAASGVPVRELFTEGRTTDTLLFWVAFFGNLLILYFVLNWFPAMLHGAGLPISTAIIATTLYSAGGAVGCAGQGYMMDWLGWRGTVIVELIVSALLIGALAGEHASPWFVWIVSAVLGLGVQGAQAGLNALAAAYYPTSVRATGLGWALGIGRIGSIIGPLLGELMLSLHWSLERIFMFGMLPALLAAVAVGAGMLHGRRSVMKPAQ